MLRLIDILSFTLERLRQHRLLVLWVLVGLVMATTLALSLSLYVDAVYTDVLQTRLSDPPYAFRFRYLGAWNGNITLEDTDRASAAIEQQFDAGIDLPVDRAVSFQKGGTWSVRTKAGLSLGTFGLGTLSGAEDQMTVNGGEWDFDAAKSEPDADGAIPVLIPETMLYGMGLQVGDELQAYPPGSSNAVTLKIAALWTPVNADDPAWIFPPKYFENVILLHGDNLKDLIKDLTKPVDETAWFVNFDGADVRTSDVAGLLTRITDGMRDVEAALPGIRVDLTPQEELNAFSAEVNQLTAQLVVILAPVGGLVLYFVSLVAGLLVNRQQAEDVKLRSRGISRRRLLAIHLLLWLVLIGTALVTGILLSPPLV
ncbi:MAG TPA: hypothetical protein VHL11_20895, partial [Phototrophicaceae bacterium]|nr:hypothetical protein [Phototrophicaceae bacterium]